jgi:ribosomal protein S12 methylthiotransferase accessory factor
VQIHGAREDTNREEFVRTLGYERMKRLNKYWYEDGETTTLVGLKDLSRNNPAESIDVIIEQLKKVVDRAIVIDLSRESIPVPVVRVIIPTFEVYTLDRDRIGMRAKSGKKRKLAEDERPWKRRARR